MEILFVRHGETEWNKARILQGIVDIELNEKGVQQAEITRKLLENESIDLIICSTLKRAKQTAQIINKGRNIPIIYNSSIIERDFGEFEGLKVDDIDFDGCWDFKNDDKYERLETLNNFFKRIYSFLDIIKKEYNDKKILIVAHGGVTVPIYCYFNGIPEGKNLRYLILNNCEVTKFKCE